MTQRPQDKPDQPLDPAVLDRLLEAIAPEAPPAALRAKVLARVQAAQSFTTIDHPSGWKSLIPGVDYKMLAFDSVAGTKSFLLRAQAGLRLPPHRHSRYEECVVLQGEFSIGDLTLRAGDFHGADAGTQHAEAYTATGVTVYLRASIDDYPGVDP